MTRPRIAIPEPSTTDPAYSQRSWPVYAKAVERAGGFPVAVPLGESQATMARIANTCSGVLLPGSPADVDPEKYGQERTRECGPKDAPREAADDLLLQDAFNLYKPIFGICYGLQALNVWRNGTLFQHLPGPPPEHLEKIDRWNPATVLVNHSPDWNVPASDIPDLDLPAVPASEIQAAHRVRLVRDSRLAAILSGAADLETSAGNLRLMVNSSHHQAVDQPGDHLRVVAQSQEDGVVEALEGQGLEPFVLAVQWHPERSYDVSQASRDLFAAFIQAARDWQPRRVTESVSG